jgi:catechol 2,3-dioxygenase-like lactoylglutathione lyase family enzyme
MKRVSHVTVLVSDIDCSQKFYESVLGLQGAEEFAGAAGAGPTTAQQGAS